METPTQGVPQWGPPPKHNPQQRPPPRVSHTREPPPSLAPAPQHETGCSWGPPPLPTLSPLHDVTTQPMVGHGLPPGWGVPGTPRRDPGVPGYPPHGKGSTPWDPWLHQHGGSAPQIPRVPHTGWGSRGWVGEELVPPLQHPGQGRRRGPTVTVTNLSPQPPQCPSPSPGGHSGFGPETFYFASQVAAAPGRARGQQWGSPTAGARGTAPPSQTSPCPVSTSSHNRSGRAAGTRGNCAPQDPTFAPQAAGRSGGVRESPRGADCPCRVPG